MILENKLSETVKMVKPSGIRKFFDLASGCPGVVSLGVGEPDFDTPWHIREEAIYALEQGNTFYTGNKGLDELRKEVALYLKRRFDLDYDWNKEIFITVGGSEAIDITMRTLLNPNDEVIIPKPAYVAYEPAVLMAQGKVVDLPLKEEEGFKITPEALEAAITDKTKVLLMNYPSNPTGGIMSKEDLEKIVPIIKKHDLIVVSDEIYAELTYESPHVSIADFEEIKDQVVLLNGFSKAYSMTGWRVGYIAANEVLINAMLKIHQFAIICPSTISQYAAVNAARDGDGDIERMKESFLQRRNYIVKGLNDLGLTCPRPQGAFYVFPSIEKTGLSSDEFCERLLKEEKVAVVPGTAFGTQGEGFIRISYAYSIDEIKVALSKIENFLNRLSSKEEK